MILGLTLARAGSKGCPNKHSRLLNGKPVIAWTIEAALKSQYLNNYIVSTNDPEVLKIAESYGVMVLKRPEELCKDETPTIPALQWSVNCAEHRLQERFDYIVEIRATSPLKTAEDIDGMIKTLVESDAESVIGITDLGDKHPARAKWLDNGYLRDFIPERSTRRQELQPDAFIRNGTVYALRRSTLFCDHPKLWGHDKSLGYQMPGERSVNIDSELDFFLCEAMLREK